MYVKLPRHEIASTTTQQPPRGCCVGVSCRGEAAVSEARQFTYIIRIIILINNLPKFEIIFASIDSKLNLCLYLLRQ